MEYDTWDIIPCDGDTLFPEGECVKVVQKHYGHNKVTDYKIEDVQITLSTTGVVIGQGLFDFDLWIKTDGGDTLLVDGRLLVKSES
jgi:hypothetical protein